ncbi:MAG: hypothetical protein CK425_12840 [Parachlamydia sp.]|nr:MAG: hypothetical protein CK425_12840 [Parachlamydia sp.]
MNLEDPDNPPRTKVMKNLYLGNKNDACDVSDKEEIETEVIKEVYKDAWDELGIKLILSVTSAPMNKVNPIEGINYVHCPVADSQDNPNFAEILSTGLRYIHDSRLKGGGVLSIVVQAKAALQPL